MKCIIKIPVALQIAMLEDLHRPHQHAFERIGFMYTRHKEMPDGSILILGQKYEPVADDNYIRDNSVGARINSVAIRHGMQQVLDNDSGCFHVHLHNHKGPTGPSSTDLVGIPGIVESMASADNNQFHGYLILSKDSAFSNVLHQGKFYPPIKTVIVGYPMNFIYPSGKFGQLEKRYARQSFLGTGSQFLLENVRVGVIGYGGGGSFIGQQLAHLGFKNVLVYDDDKVEETNLNRLIGAWYSDVKKKLQKIKIAQRVFKKLLPKNNLVCVAEKWQNKPELLQLCDIVLGGVDTYSERHQLEAECRRYLIPYIDIGMDVNSFQNGPYMSGQVVLTMPAMPCMFCTGYLSEDKLGKEAARYGDTGGRPQVVWANGVLASTAVGILIDVITGWTKQSNKLVYLSYDGNMSTVTEHERVAFAESTCKHYTLDNIGLVKFKTL